LVKILIVKLGAIGDVLRTTSLLPGLEEKYSPAKIDWITTKSSKEILLNNPLIQNIFTWEERDDLGGYDMVIGLEDDKEACELVSKIKSAKIFGSYFEKGKITYTPSAWFDMSVISMFGIDKANELKKSNRKTYQQHMAELLDVRISPYIFSLTDDEREYGEKTIRGAGVTRREKVVGINTGAGKRWPQKSWGISQTIELINKLAKELGIVSLILGGEEEKDRNQTIAKETGMPDAGVHSLRQFASIVGQCPVVLSSDSLAMHLAIALKKRVVAFFGPTSAAEIELYGLGEKLLAPMDCVVCYKKLCEVKPNCMDSLSVEKIFSAVKRQLTAS